MSSVLILPPYFPACTLSFHLELHLSFPDRLFSFPYSSNLCCTFYTRIDHHTNQSWGTLTNAFWLMLGLLTSHSSPLPSPLSSAILMLLPLDLMPSSLLACKTARYSISEVPCLPRCFAPLVFLNSTLTCAMWYSFQRMKHMSPSSDNFYHWVSDNKVTQRPWYLKILFL